MVVKKDIFWIWKWGKYDNWVLNGCIMLYVCYVLYGDVFLYIEMKGGKYFWRFVFLNCDVIFCKVI